jgi:hypothetical protein
MTPSRLRKNLRAARRFSIGHRTARSDIRQSAQIAQGSSAFITTPRSFNSLSTACQLAALLPLPSTAMRAAPKSP